MSRVMEAAMDYWERGFSDVPDKNVCSAHIDEDAIRKFINRTGIRGICDYCGYSKKILPLEDVVVYIMEGVSQFYTDPANFMSYNSTEGGYLGNVYEISELLQEQLEVGIDDNELFNDIFDSLDPTKPWANEYEYYDHEAEVRLEHWSDFKEVVKTKSRYFFSTTIFKSDFYELNAYDILEHIEGIVKKFNLLRIIPAGTSLIRCRQHKRSDKLKEAAQLCSPPAEFAIFPNRMSPAGISMFYGAFDTNTALKETLNLQDRKNPFYTSVTFNTRKQLYILDLSKAPPIPSKFEQRKWEVYYLIAFLRSFINDLTKSIVKDGKIHIDYVPTQIVTEYFRYTFSGHSKKKIDGIIYPSSKNRGKNACVLFMDHQGSLEDLEFVEYTLSTKKIDFTVK